MSRVGRTVALAPVSAWSKRPCARMIGRPAASQEDGYVACTHVRGPDADQPVDDRAAIWSGPGPAGAGAAAPRRLGIEGPSPAARAMAPRGAAAGTPGRPRRR